MANMSYCRMHNTYHDLVDVSENFGEVESEEEKMYAVRIIELCQSIAKQFGEDSSREEIEEQLPDIEDEKDLADDDLFEEMAIDALTEMGLTEDDADRMLEDFKN